MCKMFRLALSGSVGKTEGDSRLGLLCLSRHQPRALPMLRPLSAPPLCQNRKIHLSSLYVTMPSVWSVHLRMHWCSSSSTTFYVSCLYNNSCLTASIFCFVWLVLCDWFCVTFWVMQLFWVLFASTYLVAEPSTAWLAGQVLFRLVSILASWRILYFPVLFEYPVGLPQFADHLNLHLFFLSYSFDFISMW